MCSLAASRSLSRSSYFGYIQRLIDCRFLLESIGGASCPARSAAAQVVVAEDIVANVAHGLGIVGVITLSEGVAKFGGASYEVAAAATSRTTPPFGGYHRLKLRMSCPFRTAHRTCSNAFAPSLVHRMCPLRFMR